ncbi:MBL fold metallo-hydrolase [Myroides albus]|uniref:MBL fold metallo-hydrolase n=1 Tax=Myroides albus TaxID=2562892 RepID=A0A6I3LFS0_9FLAO|nr:MBL fold metallo-hydrolase [Myroides albus]MTG96757.1 MBL fold metallo-hydrolase [Myroides albus]UVD80832.1 MBL fold metallo-hydrolase [Myroides albus]
MKIEQIYTGCIAHAAYYLESEGEAAIFDPLRDVQPYIDRADADGAKIKFVFETHFHADFVSGHLDLVKKTGAKIVFGPTAQPGYDAIVAEDNQVFEIGKIKVQVLHTPGHTMESSTYLVYDEKGEKHAIITGDTLFIGDVGRPDLVQLVKSEITEEILARHLFQSLRTKIMPLPDNLIVYPNHGAGSACGKNMSKETTDTLGNQKKTNYALRADMTEDEFVKELLTGLATPPQYFPNNVLMNIQGYENLDNVLDRANKPIKLEEFKGLLNDKEILVLDTRDAQTFSEGFIPNSLNIGLKGPFAVWVGEMIKDIKQKIVLITEKGSEEESMIRLSRVGYDNTIGYLEGGFDTWKSANLPVEKIKRIEAKELDALKEKSKAVLFDVRKINEYNAEHLENSINLPLNQLEDRVSEVSKQDLLIVYCAGGYRSMIAASLLYKYGIKNIVDVVGGFNVIRNESLLPKTKFVCPSSML